jgi:hypothetical protein
LREKYRWLVADKPNELTKFVWLISHQLVVLFSHNKPAISNQPAVLFSQNKSAPVCVVPSLSIYIHTLPCKAIASSQQHTLAKKSLFGSIYSYHTA